jgi:hypothetical protein
MSRPVFRRSRMNHRRYRSLMPQHAGSRSTSSALRRVSPQRSPRVKNPPRPPQSISREGRVAIGLSLAILSFPLIVSCNRPPSRTAQTDHLPYKTDTTKPVPPTKPARTITFQGLDNDFRGSTTVMPDSRVIYRKEPP